MIENGGPPKPVLPGAAAAQAGWTRLDAAAVRERLALAGLDAAAEEQSAIARYGPTGAARGASIQSASFQDVFERVAGGSEPVPDEPAQKRAAERPAAAATPLDAQQVDAPPETPARAPDAALAAYRRMAAMRVKD